MTDSSPPPGKGKKPDPGRDAIGHEFAGEAGISESIGGPRPSPGQPVRAPMRPRPVPRAPKPFVPVAPPPPPPPPPKAPDPSIAGSKYFAPSPAKLAAPRQLSSTHRERDSDSDAFDSTLDEDLDAITRRRERERASHGPAPAHHDAPPTGGVATRKDLDAEARPRELDDGAPDLARRRRGGPSP